MKAIFGKMREPESVRRKQTLGASTGNFSKAVLDPKTIAIIKLTCHVFEQLDRQSISAMERQLNLVADQKKRVSRQVADFINRPESLGEIYKGIKAARLSGHSDVYGIFERLCVISAYSARFDRTTLQRLIAVGKHLSLSQDEIYKLVEKSKLAE